MNEILAKVSGYIQPAVEMIQKQLASLGFINLSLGMMVFLFLVLAIFLLGLSFGKSRILISILSLYVARVVESNFIYFSQIKSWLPNVYEDFLRPIIFFAVFVIVFILLSRSILGPRLSMREVSIVSAALLAVLQIGLLASIIADYLPLEFAKYCPSFLLDYFTTDAAQFWWAVLAIFALIFVKRGKRQEYD